MISDKSLFDFISDRLFLLVTIRDNKQRGVICPAFQQRQVCGFVTVTVRFHVRAVGVLRSVYTKNDDVHSLFSYYIILLILCQYSNRQMPDPTHEKIPFFKL